MDASTWANGFGVWHVRVPKGAASPLTAAQDALRDELQARDANTAERFWVEPVRVPSLDDETTIVYREADLPEDAA